MKNVSLEEKGKAVGSNGHATVVCDENGKPIPMQVTILQDGTLGGKVILIPSSKVVGRLKSYMPQSNLYAIRVKRNGPLGNVEVGEYNTANPTTPVIRTTGFIVATDGRISFCGDVEMTNPQEANTLLSGILSEAFAQAIERSYEENPQRLFYGRIAKDATVCVKEAYVKP